MYGGAAAAGDAPPAAAVEHLGLEALLTSHGVDDRLHVLESIVVELHAFKGFSRTRDHAHELVQRSHPLDGLELLEEVLESESLLAQAFFQLLGSVALDGLLGLFDQREDIAHPQDPRGHAVGMKRLQILDLFTGADEFDRLASHFANGEGGPAPGIAVHFGEDDPGESQPFVEAVGGFHRVLPQHAVGDEENLVRCGGVLDALQFAHHLFVDTQAAGRIHDDDAAVGVPSFHHPLQADVDRVAPRRLAVHGHLDGRPECLQLVDGCGPVHVGGHQQGGTSLVFELSGQLGGYGRLAAAL